MNLLQETLEDIKQSNHTFEDIVFIGSESSGYSCSWEQFTLLADREYNDGFGAPEVATDLKIVFSDDCAMWRNEYDGSEEWLYSRPFKMPDDKKQIISLFTNHIGWDDLKTINTEKLKGE